MLNNVRYLIVLAALALVPAPLFAESAGSISGTIAAPVAKFKANAVVFVKTGPKAPALTRTAVMDQRGLVFVPRVLPIQKGWTVEFLNSDPVAHTVFSIDGEKYDLGTWPKGEKRKYTFTKAGVYRQLCRVHDDMLAYVVVLDTPWFATSDKAGQFSLQGLPPGSYTLGVWHEKLGAADLAVTVTAAQDTKVEVVFKAK